MAFDIDEIATHFYRFSRFIEDIGIQRQPEKVRDNLVWKSIDGEKIQALLTDVTTHPDSWKANSKLLAEYIQKKRDEGELTSWTVALISKSANGQVPIGGHQIEPIVRAFNSDEKKLSIGRLVSPADETIDLNDEKRQEALDRTIENWRANSGAKNQPVSATGPIIREMREPQNGLLLIYPIKLENSEIPVMGFALSFPKSRNPSTVQYAVNNIYWDQEFGSQ